MNKEIQKAITSLEAKESESREAIEKAAAEVRETNAKLIELRASLDKASGRDEYIKIASEIRDNEAALSFCMKKEKEARAGALGAEEFANVRTMAKEAFAKASAEHRKAIKAEVDKLEKLINAYEADATEIHNLIEKAASLAHKNAGNDPTTAPLFDFTQENANFYPYVMAAYGKYKAALIMLEKAGARA